MLVGIVWGRRSSPPSPLASPLALHHNQVCKNSGRLTACQVRTDGFSEAADGRYGKVFCG